MKSVIKNSDKFISVIAVAQSLFIITSLLLLVAVATNSYGALNQRRNLANNTRAGMAYLVNQLKATDRAGGISVRSGPEGGSALILHEEADGTAYETRYYIYRGMLVQEYARAQDAFAPKDAYPVTQLHTLEASVDSGLVTVTTDFGSLTVFLRSEERA